MLYEDSIPVDVVDARYTSHSSQFLITDSGARIHYRVEGNHRGQTLVLLHGSGASLHTWEPWVSILEDEFKIVTLDLPGHGLTGAVPNSDYSTEASIDVINEVTSHLGLQQFVLGGNSMGGHVTWRYTLAYPQRVESMLLVDSVGLPEWWLETSSDANQAETPIIFRLLAKPWFRAVATKLDPYYLIKQAVEVAYNHSQVVNDELIMRYYDLALREGTREATMNRYANYGIIRPGMFDLSQLGQPTLILWGEEDSFIDVDIAHKFMDILPDAKLVAFEGVGHIPMEEIPEASASVVREYLQSISTRSKAQSQITNIDRKSSL